MSNYPDNFSSYLFNNTFGGDADTSVADGLSDILKEIIEVSKSGGISEAKYIAIAANLRAFTIEMKIDDDALYEINEGIDDGTGGSEWDKLSALHDAIDGLERNDDGWSSYNETLKTYHEYMDAVKASKLAGVA